jgi:hypothetical protein
MCFGRRPPQLQLGVPYLIFESVLLHAYHQIRIPSGVDFWNTPR